MFFSDYLLRPILQFLETQNLIVPHGAIHYGVLGTKGFGQRVGLLTAKPHLKGSRYIIKAYNIATKDYHALPPLYT